ncbi:MAG: transglutaminase domain-containing protein [Candidatus Dormibacteraeota bacterium]|uniref:Transglutaminase domain-containing protein n=1 Tax=Candidatus Aeolococcus gillhamiae TaxID=3127015 RepID=A0A934K413_9BACT|nr:transglutaminase domain-containing protein [Candidatus Dormibacteraeota bacterium]
MGVASASIGVRPLSPRRPATALLTALLVAATGWAVLAGGWSDGVPSVVLVGVAGALEGVALARTRVPRLVALTAAPVFLFISLLPTNAGLRPTAGAAEGFGHLVGQYASAALTGLLGNAQWEFNVALGALLWVCGAWGAWFAVREKRGATATGPCWVVIAVNVINSPSTSNATLPASLAAATAIMLIAAVHLDRLSDSWRQRRVSVLPGTNGRFAAAAAAAGVLIVLLALLAPPLSSSDISGRLFGTGSGAAKGHSGSSGSGGGLGGATVRFNAATIPGGGLTLSSTLVLTYLPSLSTGVYLRMATDSVFDGGNWLPAESANGNGDDTQEIALPGPISRDRRPAVGGVGGQQESVSVAVKMVDDTTDTNVLPFAGEPDSTTLAARVSGLTGPETTNGQLLTIDTVRALRQVMGTAFTTTATQSTATEAQLRQAGTSYPSFITRDFLGLIDDGTGGPGVIGALARQWTRTAATPYDKAAAVESALRDPKLFHYTLKPPQPPSTVREWPVTYFLTSSHSGYCQYFATAMGAMLRAVGIPSRLVNGYGPGTTPNAAARRTNPDSAWTVTSNDAHTWVEAYFPGYGWIPFEPTPSSIAGAYQPFTRGPIGTTRSVPSSGGPVAAPSPKPAPRDVTTPNGPNTPRWSGGRGLLVGLGAVAGSMILVTALFATWFLRPRNVRGVWRRVGIIGRLLGVRRDRALTFDEYVDRLTAALPTDSRASGGVHPAAKRPLWPVRLADALRDIATISDRTFYSSPSARSDELTSLRSAWRRVAMLTPHLGRGRGAEPAG